MTAEDDTCVVFGAEALQPLPNISLGKLVYDSLLSNPNTHPALVDAVTGESISYAQLLEQSCLLAASLRQSGYGLNTIISISSENSIQFFTPIIASLFIGAIVAPINHNYTELELRHSLDIFKPKIIFCSRAVCQKFVLLKANCFFIERIIVIDSDHAIPGTETLQEFVSKNLKGFPSLQRIKLAEFDPNEQIAFIMLSSGTTGLPKGVMLTHRNILVRYMHRIDPRLITKLNNFLGVLPFFHGYGLITNFNTIIVGQQIVVIKKFDEKVFLQSIQDYKISDLWLAPPLVVLLAKSPLVPKYDLSCVREITSGAAPLNKSTEELVKKRLNIRTIRQGYGLTETTLAVMMMPLHENRHGSSGKIVSYMKCKVRDPETGKSLGPEQVGELCFKGPMVMKGYYGNLEATKNSFTSDGWLLSGDLGYYDQDHYFYIVDRLKELIKYKAFQVAPAELEAVLLSNSNVQDAGVVGVPDEEAGELPLAFVVKTSGSNVTEREIVDFVAKKVSFQKRLRAGVIFVSAIPKNASGKILRRELRKMVADLLKSKL